MFRQIEFRVNFMFGQIAFRVNFMFGRTIGVDYIIVAIRISVFKTIAKISEWFN